MSSNYLEIQKLKCIQYGTSVVELETNSKLGIALNIREGIEPINGLRLNPTEDSCGWYIWAGEELSDDPDFFKPLHITHLNEWCPEIIPYLRLPPGWRFQIARDYEDVWLDPELEL